MPSSISEPRETTQAHAETENTMVTPINAEPENAVVLRIPGRCPFCQAFFHVGTLKFAIAHLKQVHGVEAK